MLAHLRGLPRALQRPHVGDYWTAWSGPGDDSGARCQADREAPSEGAFGATRAIWPRRTKAANNVKAAGVIPSRRAAWPIVRGRAAESFCRASLESPGTTA